MKKVKVDVAVTADWLAYRQWINRLPLHQMEFYRGSKKVKIDKNDLKHWRFTGLNNIDFIDFIILAKDEQP